MNEQFMYGIGLALVILYLLTGFDDFIWDIVTIFRRKKYTNELADLKKIDDVVPKLLAVTIAAWHEDNVLGDVVDNLIASVHYPVSMYHVFLGVYPNDEATIEVAKRLAYSYANVHVIINELPGPTSKAQNINYVITQIKKMEEEKQWHFEALTVHDSEDVVHPYELKVTNYLLETHSAIQFPVFPLMEMPKITNYFKNLTTNTYADEFAENHFSTMVSRCSSGAFVPCAGTGFALSRAVIDSFGGDDVLPKDSLAEDYRLSLTLYQKGIQMYYPLIKVPRINQKNKLVYEYIATRSRFPDTFKTAVKQKTRWILGITMQSFRFREIFKTKEMSFAGKYSLYRDFKAKIGNLLVLIGYPILIYFFTSFFIDLPIVYPKFSLSWYLSVVVTIMMIERQIFRGFSVYQVYGVRSMFFACLFPPMIPIRLVWGNIINFFATVKAFQLHILGSPIPKKTGKLKIKGPTNKKIVWDKTDHHFLEKQVLIRFHRKLGDVLLEKGFVAPDVIKVALKETMNTNKSLGSYLLETNEINENQLLESLAKVQQRIFLSEVDLAETIQPELANYFDESLLRQYHCVPVSKFGNHFNFFFCDWTPNTAIKFFEAEFGISITSIYTRSETVLASIAFLYAGYLVEGKRVTDIATKRFEENFLTYEQLLLVRNYQRKTNQSAHAILLKMGLLRIEPALKSLEVAV